MTQFPVSTPSEQSIYAALELSKNSWLLAIQVSDPPQTGMGTGSVPRPSKKIDDHSGSPALRRASI